MDGRRKSPSMGTDEKPAARQDARPGRLSEKRGTQNLSIGEENYTMTDRYYCPTTIGAARLRALSVEAQADPKTIGRALAGRRLYALVAARVIPVLLREGLLPVTSPHHPDYQAGAGTGA